jgi:signal transduction histidine kinase
VARESALDGRHVLELAVPAASGGLLLGFDLEEALRTERKIAMRIFLFSGTTAGLALILLTLLMRELARREEQLRQADKLSAVGRLAAGIAHEINNPLGSILGFAQAAARRLKQDDPLMPPLLGIEEEALRCRNLVQSLLTFSRQSKDLSDEFELAPAVEGTLAMLESLVRAQGVTIVRDLKGGLLAVGDRGQIQQVVMNLCTNAVDAMPGGGRLTIRSGELAGGRIFFEVEDEGTGIPEAIRGKIFDPFFTTKDVGKGTGLGLSLVHEILLRHQGTVAASFPERGSLFRVTLSGPPPSK